MAAILMSSESTLLPRISTVIIAAALAQPSNLLLTMSDSDRSNINKRSAGPPSSRPAAAKGRLAAAASNATARRVAKRTPHGVLCDKDGARCVVDRAALLVGGGEGKGGPDNVAAKGSEQRAECMVMLLGVCAACNVQFERFNGLSVSRCCLDTLLRESSLCDSSQQLQRM